MDGGEERAGEFIVACGDCSEPFYFTKESFNEVTFAVEGEVGIALDEPIGFGWNDRGNASRIERLDQGVGIIGLVCEKGFGLDFFEQWCRLAEIGRLARRERRGNGVAQSVYDDVNLRRQAATRSTDGLADPPFFRAPALCWWARTTVESSIMYSLSLSSTKALKIRSKTPLSHHRRNRL